MSRIPRFYRRHDTQKARFYTQEYRRIASRFGQPIPKDYKQDAAAVSDLWATYRLLAIEVEQTEARRREGTGRRPSAPAVRSLQKRQALTFESYRAARLELEQRLAAMTSDAFDHFLGDGGRR